MNIISMRQIGELLGISKQAVSKHIKPDKLIQENGKIDLDNPQNQFYLESKGVDLSVFGVKKQKKQAPAMKKNDDPEEEKEEIERTPQARVFAKLELQIKLENIRSKQKDSELKTLKIQEMKGILIPRKIVDQLIGDFFGRFNEMLLIKPKGIIGDIKAEVKDGTDQTLISYLQKAYMIELEKLLQNAKKRYLDAIENQIKEIKEDGK
jgi:hypothetical protein